MMFSWLMVHQSLQETVKISHSQLQAKSVLKALNKISDIPHDKKVRKYSGFRLGGFIIKANKGTSFLQIQSPLQDDPLYIRLIGLFSYRSNSKQCWMIYNNLTFVDTDDADMSII